MMQIVPNSGIFNNERLDRERVLAMVAVQGKGLPEAVVYYLRSLEDAYLSEVVERKKRSLADIRWRFDTELTEGPDQSSGVGGSDQKPNPTLSKERS